MRLLIHWKVLRVISTFVAHFHEGFLLLRYDQCLCLSFVPLLGKKRLAPNRSCRPRGRTILLDREQYGPWLLLYIMGWRVFSCFLLLEIADELGLISGRSALICVFTLTIGWRFLCHVHFKSRFLEGSRRSHCTFQFSFAINKYL